MRRKPLLLLCGTLAFAAPHLGAQQAALLPRLPASARALALGDILPPGSRDAAAIFYNPAFARELPGIAGGALWVGADTVALTAAGAVEWLGGAAALGVRTLDYTRPYSGPPLPANVVLSPEAVSERVAQVSFARRIGFLSLGMTGKYIDQRFRLFRGSTWAVDAGAGAAAGPVLLGLATGDLGRALTAGSEAAPLPHRLFLSAAPVVAAPVGPLDVLPAVQLGWERGARFAPAAALELGYWPVIGRTFYLRGGVRRSQAGTRPFTFGAGFSGDRISLDYAFAQGDGGRSMQSVGIRWH